MIELSGHFFEDIDECLSLPCTHGTCHNSIGSYSCTCDSGWTGFNCDTGIYRTLRVSKMSNILKLHGIQSINFFLIFQDFALYTDLYTWNELIFIYFKIAIIFIGRHR